MSDIRERAVEAMARAMFDADQHSFNWEDVPDDQDYYRDSATAALTALHRIAAAEGARLWVPVVATERMLSSAGYDSDVWSYRDDFVSREDRIHEWKNWVAAAPDPFAEPEA